MRKINKRGAEMTIGTLVIIVLAILVLVVLVVGFTGGWGSLWDKIKNLFGGEANVDTIKQACASVCLTKSSYDYCTMPRTLKYAGTDKIDTATVTCDSFRKGQDKDGKTIPVKGDTCDISCTPAKKCTEQTGTHTNGKAGECSAEGDTTGQCKTTNIIKDTDVVSPKVCCNVPCNT